jgi:RNA polymerase sigma factor (sigma-70 family)
MTARSAETAQERRAESRKLCESLGDQELVSRCSSGDSLAWEVLVRRYRRLVYAIPHRAGLDADRAEEVFHQTFSKLAVHVRSIRDPSRIQAWVVTTARRLTIDAIRERKSQGRNESETLLQGIADEKPGVLEEIELLQAQHLVRRALGAIPASCRKLISKLFYYPDQPPPYESVAEDLGIPIGSIGPTRARCLKKLLAEYRKLEREE